MMAILAKFFSIFERQTETVVSSLDYAKLIHLDAENLAEEGMAEAYRRQYLS